MSSIIDKIAEFEKERANNNYKMQRVMDSHMEYSEDENLIIQYFVSGRYGRLYQHIERDLFGCLFNDHSILGYQDRSVND